jgi:hypothetical protein
MWLDFNDMHTLYDVAIVISIQGVNAITGLETEDVILEQYKEECPKHKTKFGPHRYCEKCGFRWPKQNYLCSTGQPLGQLWIDGFRAADGFVRQYILSEDKMKGVACNIIGESKRVHAIGLSFFLSKSQKPQQEPRSIFRGSMNAEGSMSLGNVPHGTGIIYGQPQFSSPVHTPINWSSTDTHDGVDTSVTCCSDSSSSQGSPQASFYSQPFGRLGKKRARTKGVAKINKLMDTPKSYVAASGIVMPDSLDSDEVCYASAPRIDEEPEVITENQMEQPIKKLEVGAGAKVKQKIYDDPNELDFWREKPEAVLVINYCPENLAKQIISAGEKDVDGSKEGFLKDVPAGN